MLPFDVAVHLLVSLRYYQQNVYQPKDEKDSGNREQRQKQESQSLSLRISDVSTLNPQTTKPHTGRHPTP